MDIEYQAQQTISSDPASTAVPWDYREAFSRNAGLVSPSEQERLRGKRVAICGMGGVGGIDLITLVRLGVGKFTIADPDKYQVANFNRQYGAMCSTVNRSKAEVMAQIALDINPELDIRVFAEPIRPDNAEDFLRDADIFVDAIEVFEPEIRRLLFRLASSKNIFSITAGPVGFSGVWIIFDPQGMKFDEYFDMSDGMDADEKLAAFAVGVAPKATHRPYMDLRFINIAARIGPSSSVGCHIAAGAMACEAVKILLSKGTVKSAPHFHQFDPFVGRYASGKVRGGNRNFFQRLKRRLLVRMLRSQKPR